MAVETLLKKELHVGGAVYLRNCSYKAMGTWWVEEGAAH